MTNAETTPSVSPACGLVLPGGGARAAYQAGVIKAIGELIPSGAPNPFPVISGTSAGAINATMLASNAQQFQFGAARLGNIWDNLTVDRVYRADMWTLLRSMLLHRSRRRQSPVAILDNSPLRDLLNDNIYFPDIEDAIKNGALRALALTASGYSSARSITFFHGADDIAPWQRERREGRPEPITLEHIMASIALPLVFPSVALGNEYFGDGSMRQAAPLSAPIHLGARKLLIVSVRDNAPNEVLSKPRGPTYPSIGYIAGYVFDTLFMDSLDADRERLMRINRTYRNLPEWARDQHTPNLKPINTLLIAPSRDIREIADRHRHEFPRAVNGLLKRLGTHRVGGDQLISYLLFSGSFCSELVDLGYRDAMAHQIRIRQFLGYADEDGSA